MQSFTIKRPRSVIRMVIVGALPVCVVPECTVYAHRFYHPNNL